MNQGRKDPRECSTCFSTTEFPGTVLEENGQCNRCNSNYFEDDVRRQTTSDLSELHSLANKRKFEKVGKYDCIIGASGGFDSSYIIYVAKKLLELNPLVVKYDHGFNHEIADQNLRTICENLKVDLKIIKTKEKNDFKYIRFTALALRDIGLYWGICRFCRYAVGAVALREARSNNAPLILEAFNKYEKDDSLSSRVKFKIIWNRLSKVCLPKWPRIAFYFLAARYHLLRLRIELYVPPLRNLFRTCPRSKSIEKLYLSDYLKWDIRDISRILIKETGWTCPYPEMPLRFDCQIEDSFCNYTSKKATGITNHAIICNKLIYARIRRKDELYAIVDDHDKMLDRRMKEMRLRLNMDLIEN